MAKSKRLDSAFLTIVLAILVTAAPPYMQVAAQEQPKPSIAAPASDFATRLAAVEKAVDGKRQELGVPGASLVIVKDDKVIYMKGLGVKDAAHVCRLPRAH